MMDNGSDPRPKGRTDRRGFLRGAAASVAAIGVGAQTLLRSGDLSAAVSDAKVSAGGVPDWPQMTYRTLGRTGFKASRLFFGCGAALARRPRDELLDTALRAGINVFDVGFSDYYHSAEQNLAPFLKQHREDIFLISKAYFPIDAKPNESIDVATAKRAAAKWSGYLDGSLKELRTEQVDAYYTMAAYNPSAVRSEELGRAFEQARDAGKVRFLGLSTHQNPERVMEAAIDTGWYDLAMIAVTPAGWYDWESKGVLKGTKTLKELRPLLERAREAGIGLVGMKAGRFLAGRSFLGGGREDAFNDHYDGPLMQAPFSAFQRSYAYVLAHGLDVVNADMQSLSHLRENFVAAATTQQYIA